MARGKYAAKAANRLSQLDGELVEGLRRERDEARDEAARTALELELLRSRLSSTVIAEVSRQTSDVVARADDRVREAEVRAQEFRIKAALYVARVLRGAYDSVKKQTGVEADTIPGDIDGFFESATPHSGRLMTVLLDGYGSWGNRAHRRWNLAEQRRFMAESGISKPLLSTDLHAWEKRVEDWRDFV